MSQLRTPGRCRQNARPAAASIGSDPEDASGGGKLFVRSGWRPVRSKGARFSAEYSTDCPYRHNLYKNGLNLAPPLCEKSLGSPAAGAMSLIDSNESSKMTNSLIINSLVQ